MDGSVLSPKRPAYNLEWANKVVNDFQDAYPRATELVCMEFEFSLLQAVQCLAFRKKSWENFKKVVKLTDRYLQAQRNSGQLELPEAIRSAIRSYATRYGWVKITKPLTRAPKTETV